MSQYPNKKWRLTFIIKIRREIMDIKYIVRLIILYVQYTVWLLLLKIHFDLIKSEYLILGRRLEELCNANTRWQMELIALNKIYWDKLVLVLSLINAINTNILPPLYTGPQVCWGLRDQTFLICSSLWFSMLQYCDLWSQLSLWGPSCPTVLQLTRS